MSFDLESAIQVLESTPRTLEAWLGDLGEEWTGANEGPGTFDPVDVVGHLIQGEREDWLARVRAILNGASWPVFEPLDRAAQLEADRGIPVSELVGEFSRLRRKNLLSLRSLRLGAEEFDRVGIHPDLGDVTLREVLATWVVHDLDHIGQIARVMAKRYTAEVGRWTAFLPVLRRGPSE